MMSGLVILDSDTISLLMRRDINVVLAAREYAIQNGSLTFSLISRYEILRGLHANRSPRLMARFEAMCANCSILPVTWKIVDRAAEIYGDLYRSGQIIDDADILIAATALESGAAVATNNTSHFTRIQGLTVENWHRRS